jgi:phosphohistidine phosphatase
MEFYLVRHGEAVSQPIDGQRPLTPAGRHDVEGLGRAAAARNVRPRKIFHSGLLRAQQTAELLSQSLGGLEEIRELDGLRPDDHPVLARAELESSTVSLMLVGHLPHMSRLASCLVAGDPERRVVEFAPATMVCLSYDDIRWKLLWKLTSTPVSSS